MVRLFIQFGAKCLIIYRPVFPENFIPLVAKEWLKLIGHPFSALIHTNLIVWYALGIRKDLNRTKLLDITSKSMALAGVNFAW
jgi:Gnt-I system low-affinity gluconate transporter